MKGMGKFRTWLRYGSLFAIGALLLTAAWDSAVARPKEVLGALETVFGRYGVIALFFGLGGIAIDVWLDAFLERFDKQPYFDLGSDMKNFGETLLGSGFVEKDAVDLVLPAEQAYSFDRRMEKLKLGQLRTHREMSRTVSLLVLARTYVRLSGPLYDGDRSEAIDIFNEHNKFVENWTPPTK